MDKYGFEQQDDETKTADGSKHVSTCPSCGAALGEDGLCPTHGSEPLEKKRPAKRTFVDLATNGLEHRLYAELLPAIHWDLCPSDLLTLAACSVVFLANPWKGLVNRIQKWSAVRA